MSRNVAGTGVVPGCILLLLWTVIAFPAIASTELQSVSRDPGSDLWLRSPGSGVDLSASGSAFHGYWASSELTWHADVHQNVSSRQGGDTCETAVELVGPLPISVIGSTIGFQNDLDSSCPYTGSTAPDVVYMFTPDADIRVNISLCMPGSITDFDTKLYVYEADCGNPDAIIACNDDQCSTVLSDNVSRITDLQLSAETMYFIVVDGYAEESGNYQLDITEFEPVSPGSQCPPGNLFGQNWNYASVTSSDERNASQLFDSFSGVDQDIHELRWWGLNILFVSGMPVLCQKDPDSFSITFYEDHGGVPGQIACGPYIVTPTKTDTGVLFNGVAPVFEYATTINPSCSLTDGWISIVGLDNGVDDCWFMWHASVEGDLLSLLNNDQGWGTVGLDLSICLNPAGACCDDEAGRCVDSMSWLECEEPLRYTPGVLCADLETSCGDGPLGACCVDDQGVCDVMTEAECLAVSGTYAGDFVPCDPNPCTGACCFGDGSCRILSEAQCLSVGGSFSGNETICVPNSCPQPGEDCSDAIPIDTFPFQEIADNTWSTGDGPAGSCNMPGMTVMLHDRWYSFTAPDDGYILVDIHMHDHGLFVIHEGICDGSSELYCDSIWDKQNLSIHPVSAGTPYWFQVGAYATNVGGKYTFAFDFVTELPLGACCYHDSSCSELNEYDCGLSGGWYQGDATTCASDSCLPAVPETCETAMDVSGLGWSVTINNDYALADGPPASCDSVNPAPTVMQNDMWFRWVADEDCLATLTVSDDEQRDDYRLHFVVWQGDACQQLQEIQCMGSSPVASIEWAAEAGETYWFQVGHNHPSMEGGGPTTIELTGLTGMGSCCFLDGACMETPAAECLLSLGGLDWNAGGVCSPNSCPQPAPGDLCASPIQVTLPAEMNYLDAHQHTCGRGNNTWTSCLGLFDNNEDIYYELTVTESICVDISVFREDGNETIGVVIDPDCPPGRPCLGEGDSMETNTNAVITGLGLVPGVYTLMVDSWQECITDFTLSITESDNCPTSACCFADAPLECVDTFIEDCESFGGYYHDDGSSCSHMDCNNNGVDDSCDVYTLQSPDCNENGIPDECDIASGMSDDYDSNLFPDECQFDCNGNGISDACDTSCEIGNCSQVPQGCELSDDCQGDGIPDECQLGGTPLPPYQVDDGTHETSVGYTAVCDLGWLNHYRVQAGQETIGAIELAWGEMYFSCGNPCQVYLWSDPDGDGNPADAQVLATAQTISENCDTDLVKRVTIPETYVGTPGTSFFVGAIMQHAAGEFPISIDLGDSQGQSWFVASMPGSMVPNDLASAMGGAPVLLNDVFDGNGGNAIVRAIPVIPGTDVNGNQVPDGCERLGDIDGDGDVDLDDFSNFVSCLQGPGVMVSGNCELADLDEDGDVDLEDMANFQMNFGIGQ